MPNVLQTNIHTIKPTTHNSNGKHYNKERAIISLTSWKARIGTVVKTLFSLYKQCPGFHIVLVLSEDEFPQKENELPENLMLFVNNDIVELLWVQQNLRSMKKVIFTMHKYPDVPIISADDDCLYTENYAEYLYNAWAKNKDTIFRYVKRKGHERSPQGPCTIYPPENVCHLYERVMPDLEYGATVGDDDAIKRVIARYDLKVGCLGRGNPFVFHTTIGAMHKCQRNSSFYRGCF